MSSRFKSEFCKISYNKIIFIKISILNSTNVMTIGVSQFLFCFKFPGFETILWKTGIRHRINKFALKYSVKKKRVENCIWSLIVSIYSLLSQKWFSKCWFNNARGECDAINVCIILSNLGNKLKKKYQGEKPIIPI